MSELPRQHRLDFILKTLDSVKLRAMFGNLDYAVFDIGIICFKNRKDFDTFVCL